MGLFGRKRFAGSPSGPDTSAMDPLDVLRQARPWIMSEDFLAPETMESFRYRRAFGDGLIAVIAVAHSEHATLMSDDDVAAFDLESLWTVAVQSLQYEPIDEIMSLPAGEAECQVVLGRSACMASYLLALPELLERATGSPDAPRGVVVAVPTQNQVVHHVVRGFEAIQAVSRMQTYAEEMYADAKTRNALSPNVYYWRPDGLKRMTFPKAGGGIELRFEEDVVSAMADADE